MHSDIVDLPAAAVQAAEEARYIAEMENEENKTAQKIKENGKRKLKRLTTESERLDDAMQTDMKKKHQEIAKWCLSAFLYTAFAEPLALLYICFGLPAYLLKSETNLRFLHVSC